MIKFWHELPRPVEVVPNRKVFTLDYAKGRKVLHVGCVDTGVVQDRMQTQSHLHLLLMKVAERAWGVDVNREGIELMQDLGVPDLFWANGEDLAALDLGDQPDLVVAAEVLEHVSNPGLFLDSLRAFNCEVLITVPNAFSARGHACMRSGKEFVHEDHNYYFSYVTLKTLVEKHGFRLKRLAVYYWPSNDEIGQELERMIAINPLFGEGLIFVIEPKVAELPDRKGYSIVLADEDEERFKQVLSTYLAAFEPEADVVLYLPAGSGIRRMESLVLDLITERGLSPEAIPDVVLLDQPLTEEVLRAADLVIGSPTIASDAQRLGKPAYVAPEAGELLEAVQRHG